VSAVLAGTWWHRPARRLPWWLLAGALAAMAAGDTVYAVAGRPGEPAPAWADAGYLLMFPLLAAGLVLLTRSSVVLRDRTRLLDMLTFACGAVLVGWVVSGGPALRASGLSADERWTTVAYMVGDLLLVLTTARLVVAARRSPAVVLLAVGALGSLAGDLGYAQAQLTGGWTAGSPAELGYLVLYTAWGLAALHPSMAELTVPVRQSWAEPRRRSVVLLAMSLAIPPAVLLVQSVWGAGGGDGVVIAAVSAAVFGLAVLRLSDAMAGYGAAVARERSLREACGSLVAAADAEQVDAGVRRAVGTIMPAHVPYGVVFVLDGAPYPLPDPERRTRLLAAAELDAELRAALGAGHPAALVCPLVLDRRSADDPRTGAVVVAAEPAVLVSVQDAVEVLVAQAALALERIALTAAAVRRDRDEYLQTVVSQTSDVVLIADDDGRVRYASPSLESALGVSLPLFATVRDLVAPEDHRLVSEAFARAAWQGPEGLRALWNVLRPDGRRVLVRARFRDLRDDRMVGGFVVTLREVTGQDAEAVSAEEVQFLPGGWNRRSSTDKFR
jgi:PAS domain S-box-containing protein